MKTSQNIKISKNKDGLEFMKLIMIKLMQGLHCKALMLIGGSQSQ